MRQGKRHAAFGAKPSCPHALDLLQKTPAKKATKPKAEGEKKKPAAKVGALFCALSTQTSGIATAMGGVLPRSALPSESTCGTVRFSCRGMPDMCMRAHPASLRSTSPDRPFFPPLCCLQKTIKKAGDKKAKPAKPAGVKKTKAAAKPAKKAAAKPAKKAAAKPAKKAAPKKAAPKKAAPKKA